jgi:hypothetical protein
MQKRSKRGPVHWIHFWCGAGLGGFEGARVGFCVLDHWWAILLVVVGAAGVLGLCAGLGGDSFWQELSFFDWLL